jgi:hypothetical protein
VCHRLTQSQVLAAINDYGEDLEKTKEITLKERAENKKLSNADKAISNYFRFSRFSAKNLRFFIISDQFLFKQMAVASMSDAFHRNPRSPQGNFHGGKISKNNFFLSFQLQFQQS